MLRILAKKQEESKARAAKGVSLWMFKVNPEILKMKYAKDEISKKGN